MPEPLALVTGVGPGTGSSIVRRLAGGGMRVVMLARSAERLAALEAEIPNAYAFPCDVTDQAAVDAVLAGIRARFGDPSIFVHNAVGGSLGKFSEIDPALLERYFRVNVMALLHLARKLTPAMQAAGEGAVIVTGNTSALRGRPNFAALAPTKAAQRILSECLARELGPQGIHVAYLVIDGVIDGTPMRGRFPDKPPDFFISPDAIASEVWHLLRQPRSAWSFNAELRPYAEVW